MKKTIQYAVIGALCAGMLAGCGKTQPSQTSQPDITAGTTAPAQQTIALKNDEIHLTKAGFSYDLYSGSADPAEVAFGSEDESIATFSQGTVTAVGSGTTTVFAQYGSERLECTVVCALPAQPDGTAPTQETTLPPTEAPTEAPAEATTAPTAAEPELPVSTGGSRDPVQTPPGTANVDSSFFDDAVFIGDSVSLKLSYYAGDTGALGKAQFLVRGSYSMEHAYRDSMLLSYQGVEYKIEDAVAATGAKKVFIMLGMNDIGIDSIENIIQKWESVVNRIRVKCPDVQIYIQSASPVYTGGEIGDLNNEKMDRLNAALESFAASHQCSFVSVAPYMKDSTNGLAAPYCSDEYVHVTDAGAAAWIKVLKASV